MYADIPSPRFSRIIEDLRPAPLHYNFQQIRQIMEAAGWAVTNQVDGQRVPQGMAAVVRSIDGLTEWFTLHHARVAEVVWFEPIILVGTTIEFRPYPHFFGSSNCGVYPFLEATGLINQVFDLPEPTMVVPIPDWIKTDRRFKFVNRPVCLVSEWMEENERS